MSAPGHPLRATTATMNILEPWLQPTGFHGKILPLVQSIGAASSVNNPLSTAF